MIDIQNAIKSCEQSIFIFDEVDKMPAGVFESIASILDYHGNFGSSNFRKAIFIFLTNAGGNEIADALDRIMSNGKYREQTKIQDFESIAEAGAFYVKGGLMKATIITSGLIDHFLPFLPLERRHIANCVRAEYKKLKKTPTDEDVKYV